VRDSYRNPYAFHSIRLTSDQYPETRPELRACIVDEKMVRFRVIRDLSLDGQRFKLVTGSFRQRIRNSFVKEWTLPLDRIITSGETMAGLLYEDRPVQVLDLGMAHHTYEEAEPPEWYEKEIRLFEILDKYDPPPDSAVLFTGSSTIRRWHSLGEDMYPWKVINRGFGGSVMKELNENIDRIVFPYNPSRIIVYEGDNDIARGTGPAAFLEECREFIQRCQQQLPETEIIFLSIKPSPARMRYWKQMNKANHMLEDLTEMHEEVMFIDISTSMFTKPGILKKDIFAPDGVHLNEKGYALLRQSILESMAKSTD
jgi:lysophospholipase L1-like esterase